MSSSNGAIMGVKRGLSLCQNSSPTIENESGTARICTPNDDIRHIGTVPNKSYHF